MRLLTLLRAVVYLLGCYVAVTNAIHVPDLVLSPPGGYVFDPFSVVIGSQKRIMFLSDQTRNRILRFEDIDNLIDTSTPAAVLGQPDFGSISANQGGAGPTASTLSSPKALFYEEAKDRLWAVDSGNYRVLWYDTASTRINGTPADGVLGQPDFMSGGSPSSAAANNMNVPEGVWNDGANLWISDSFYHRILRFPSSPASFSSAQGVVGQTSFTGMTGGTSASQLLFPKGVMADSSGLYVLDYSNNRMVFFPRSEATLPNSGQATIVYGQVNLTQGGIQPDSIYSMGFPVGGFLTKQRTMYVADANGNRVLAFYPTPPKVSAAVPAIDVFGQPDFVTGSSGAEIEKMNSPRGVCYDPVRNSLWVVDTMNTRILRFPDAQLIVDTNITTLDVEMMFQGNSPFVRMVPKPLSGSDLPGLFIQPTQIDELDSDGMVVNTTAVPLTGYTVNTSVDSSNNQKFSFSIDTERGRLEIIYTLFAEGQTINSAGVSFSTQPSVLKLELRLGPWYFQETDNSLRVHVMIEINPYITGVLQSNPSPDVYRFTINSDPVLTTVLNLIGFAVADGENVPVGYTLTNQTINSNYSRLELLLDFPFFNESLQYDPDFGVATQGSSEGDGDSGNDDLLPLLALIALVIPIAFFLIAVVILVVILVRRYRFRQATRNTASHNVEI